MKNKIVTLMLSVILFVMGYCLGSANAEVKYVEKPENKLVSTQCLETVKQIKETEKVEEIPICEELPKEDNIDYLLENKDFVLEIIKSTAQEEWKDDYEMVKYQYDNQKEAFNNICDNYESMDRTILNKALDTWVNDFEMVIYEYNKQKTAKDSL